MPAAKTNVQAKTRMNGERTFGSWMIAEKFDAPMYVFQPGWSAGCPGVANSPLPSSR